MVGEGSLESNSKHRDNGYSSDQNTKNSQNINSGKIMHILEENREYPSNKLPPI